MDRTDGRNDHRSDHRTEHPRRVNAEVVDESAEMQTLRWLARWMDDVVKIPGLGARIGLDGIIGLVPVVGDLAGFAVSGYFLTAAARMNVPKIVLLRMLANIGIDSLLSMVPFIGDIFDFAWKANRRNYLLLEQSLASPRKTQKRSIGFFILMAIAFVAIVIGATALTVFVLRAIMGLVDNNTSW